MAYADRPAALFSGGLNLRDSYEQMEPNQAYDLLNVAFDNKGGVKSRPGYAAFTAAGTNRYDSMAAFYTTGGIKHLVCGAGNRLEVFDSTGTAVTSSTSTSPTASPHYFARFGGPTKTVLYAANGTDKLRTWDGSAWAVPTFTGLTDSPKGKYLAVTPWDNRLVNARRSGTSGGNNPSTVCFSDPSVPDTWQTYNWVDVTPGDGEQIMGMCVFNNYLIVFKESHYFVFYGTTINPEDGTPEFNYRAVESGIGLAAPNALCVAPDGVYFLSDNGIYKTDGGLPVLVSGLIDSLFTGSVPPLYGGYAINTSSISTAAMAYHNLQVFLAVPTASATANDALLMFDLRNQSWTVWNIPAGAMCQFEVTGSQPDLMFAYASGAKKIGRISTGYTTDDGADIPSRIKIAFNDLGEDNHKTIRESKVWGTGIVRFGIADDFATAENLEEVDFGQGVDKWSDGNNASDNWADGTDANDLWANSVGTHAHLVRTSVRGTYLSIELYSQSVAGANTSPAWSVNRVVHHMRERRVPSVTNLDGE